MYVTLLNTLFITPEYLQNSYGGFQGFQAGHDLFSVSQIQSWQFIFVYTNAWVLLKWDINDENDAYA